jgi:hypothetical protein
MPMPDDNLIVDVKAEKKIVSVQSQPESDDAPMLMPMSFFSTDPIAPGWDAQDRDAWLRGFWHDFGNDLIAAAVATCVAKIQTQNWTLSGPKRATLYYHRALREDSDFGRGWSTLIARGVTDYYTQDNGWFIERQRSSAKDFEGAAMGFAHLDSARMIATGNPEYPYYYWDVSGEYHLLHKSQMIRIVDMPTPVTSRNSPDKGFCALSRTLSTAMVLTLIAAMKREKLSDLPPSAIAIFNNISKKQFENSLSLHGIEQRDKGNMVWRNVMPMFGIDPAHPASMSFQSLREVWDNFDEMTAMNVAVYSIAAGFRIDPREIWPASSGPLGTGKEAEIQHEKAKSKSHGLIFTEIERHLNHRFSLPEDVTFKFELQDSEESQLTAAIESTQIGNIKAMQDAGAGLTPAEVRFLLSKKYGILPPFMSEVPKEGEESAFEEDNLLHVYLDDAERIGAATKELMDDLITCDLAGVKETVKKAPKAKTEDISLLPEAVQENIRMLGMALDAGFENRLARYSYGS